MNRLFPLCTDLMVICSSMCEIYVSKLYNENKSCEPRRHLAFASDGAEQWLKAIGGSAGSNHLS